MTEEKKKRLKGFAGIVAKQVEPLNSIEKFKEDFKDTELKILLNAKDGKYAALLIIEKGTLIVKSISNQPKSNLEKKVIGWDGYISMDTQIFLSLAMKRLSIVKLGLKIITGNVKIKGIFKLLAMLKLIKILTE